MGITATTERRGTSEVYGRVWLGRARSSFMSKSLKYLKAKELCHHDFIHTTRFRHTNRVYIRILGGRGVGDWGCKACKVVYIRLSRPRNKHLSSDGCSRTERRSTGPSTQERSWCAAGSARTGGAGSERILTITTKRIYSRKEAEVNRTGAGVDERGRRCLRRQRR